MPADISFILGRNGAENSRLVHSRIKETLSRGQSVILIVPEQFTFETERQLSEELGGLMNIEVYSFTTLAEKVLDGRISGFLSRQGRQMAVRKVIGEEGDALTVFSRVKDRPGFAAELDGIFTMCKRFEISPEELSKGAEKLPEGLLKSKLTDIALIYGGVESFLAGRYMDTEDIFTALHHAIPASFICGAEVMIDGFDMLTNQLYRVIEDIMEHAGRLTVTFRIDPSNTQRDRQVFAAEHKVYKRIYEYARGIGAGIEVTALPCGADRHPALSHLEHEAFAYPYNKYGGEAPITVYCASGMAEECEAAAEAVLSAAQSGMRYRDMAVISAGGDHSLQLARAFRRRGIPYFSDAAHKLSAYPAPRLINAAIQCAVRGYTPRGLTELIRTGLCGVSAEEGDKFENYLLQKGIKWTGFTRPFEDEAMEAVRQRIMEPLAALRSALAAAPTAKGKAEAVYDYMESIGIYAEIQSITEVLLNGGRLELMEEHRQVYRNILTVLDQLYAILGDSRISTARFAAILSEGFDAYEISAIPATADQVIIGSVGKTRSRPIKALFILGANEGSFPRYINDDSMINDRELSDMASLGMNTWDSGRDRADIELMDVYSALTKPTEMLWLSYSMDGSEGGGERAAVVDRIMDIFPNIAFMTGLDRAKPGSKDGGFDALAAGLRAMGDSCREDESLKPLYAYFATNANYHEGLKQIEDALYYRCSPEPFGHELSLRLYGDKLFGSATRLERFNACPFRHFVLNGLKARERMEYKERRADEGTFCHEALDAFIKKTMETDILALTDEDCDRLLDELMPEVIARHNGGVLMDSARNKALCGRLSRTVHTTAKAIVRQAKAGQFRPMETEVQFGAGGLPALTITTRTGETFYIGGRIDRIDGCKIEDREYFRIIDYKTGSAGFDYGRLYHGLSLQLPLYTAAIGAVYKASAAGMYYMHVKSPTLDEEENIEKEIMTQFRLKGLTLSDPEIIKATAGEGGTDAPIATGRAARGFVTAEELGGVMKYAKARSAETLENIFEGHAEAAPAAMGGSDPCEYCESSSVCGFDSNIPGCAYRRLSAVKKEDFFGNDSK